MNFYNAKVNGKWKEVYTISKRSNKKDALKIFQKYDTSIKLNDVWMSINAPEECPLTFNDIDTLQ